MKLIGIGINRGTRSARISGNTGGTVSKRSKFIARGKSGAWGDSITGEMEKLGRSYPQQNRIYPQGQGSKLIFQRRRMRILKAR